MQRTGARTHLRGQITLLRRELSTENSPARRKAIKREIVALVDRLVEG